MKSWDIVQGLMADTVEGLIGPDRHCIIIFEVEKDSLGRESADYCLQRAMQENDTARNVILRHAEEFSNKEHNKNSWMLLLAPNGGDGSIREIMELLEMPMIKFWHHGNNLTHLKWYVQQESIMQEGVVVGNVLDMLIEGDRPNKRKARFLKRDW